MRMWLLGACFACTVSWSSCFVNCWPALIFVGALARAVLKLWALRFIGPDFGAAVVVQDGFAKFGIVFASCFVDWWPALILAGALECAVLKCWAICFIGPDLGAAVVVHDGLANLRWRISEPPQQREEESVLSSV